MDNKNNTEKENSGNRNSGDWNSGNRNSGDRNSGYRNSGYWNSGDWNSGIFNTNEPFMRAFNKETKIKMSDFLNSEDYIYFDIPLNELIYSENMTDQEKKDHPKHETTGGYLKTLEYKDAWKEWWKENKSEEMIAKIKKLPNFDSEIFKSITGIEINEVSDEVSEAIKILEKAGVLKDGKVLIK